MTVRCAWCQSILQRAGFLRRCLGVLRPVRVSHGCCVACLDGLLDGSESE